MQRVNANMHPGRIVNEQKQVRRTKEQKAADDAREVTEKANAAKAALVAKKLKIGRLAQIEHDARQSDALRAVLRPDLTAEPAVAEQSSAEDVADHADIQINSEFVEFESMYEALVIEPPYILLILGSVTS